MNALNRSTQIFTKILYLNSSILFSMTLQRVVLFLVVVRHWLFGADGLTVGMSFINGVRFDLCVLGFLNIPVLLIVWAISSDYFVNTSNRVVQFIRRWTLWIYVGVTTLVIHVLGLLDMMFFALNNHRWTFYDWQATGLSFVEKIVSTWGLLFTLGVVALFLMLWLFRCIYVFYKAQLPSITLETAKIKGPLGVLLLTGIVLPFFVVALAARGTWTAHHINIEHAQVSQNQVLNQMTLSPVWAFDKKF